MTKEDVNKFEKVQSQIEGLLLEVTNLAKKSPNDAVNKFKLKFINEILTEANKILGKNLDLLVLLKNLMKMICHQIVMYHLFYYNI